MQLESPHVFGRGLADRLVIQEGLKLAEVVGVSIDRIDRHIADFHILGESNASWRCVILVRRHVDVPSWQRNPKPVAVHWPMMPECFKFQKAQWPHYRNNRFNWEGSWRGESR